MQSALPLRPPPFFQLFSNDSFELPPPPLPDFAAEQPNILGIRTDPSSGFVLPLDKIGIEQLYDEKCFDAAAVASGSCTPKNELKRLSAELKSHVHLVALALADEALGVHGSPASAPVAASSSLLSFAGPSSALGEPRSLCVTLRVGPRIQRRVVCASLLLMSCLAAFLRSCLLQGFISPGAPASSKYDAPARSAARNGGVVEA